MKNNINPSFKSRKTKTKKRVLKKFISFALAGAVLFSSISAYASILGEQTSHSETEYAQGTTYNRNTFTDSSVGQQTENYFEYVPNNDVLPIISNGSQVYGKRTVLEANEYLNQEGIFAAMGMNADFFSFTTGVPMSNTIYDGHVLTADTSYLPGLGFNADGTAFITDMQLSISAVVSDGTTFGIECLNKYRQPYVMYLYTDEFGDYTNASGSGINVVLGDVSGEFVLGQPVTATVESITTDNGSVEIPDGKLLISIDSDIADEVKARIANLAVGQTVTFTINETTGDTRWQNAVYGTGCLGGTLITNGELNYEDESAAPRSAVGIKADGTVIFYTIDGRQSGYSYGVRKETLAKRLLELGCVDAVNMDGGGSTQLAGTLPETTEMTILNSPSETLRQCANFIFLKKMNAPDGIPYKLLTYPYGEYILSGSTIGVWVSAIDASYGTATITEPVTYSIQSGNAEINQDGYATVHGDEDVYIASASGAATGLTMVHSVSTPDTITITNEETGANITFATVTGGDTLSLSASASYSDMTLTSTDDAYTWSVSPETLGTISSDGTFSAGTTSGSGYVTASAGSTSATISVTVSTENMPTATPEPKIPETEYPSIVCSASDTAFTARIDGTHGTTDTTNITFKVDGLSADFEYSTDTSTLVYTFPEDFTSTAHIITVSVTDNSGYSAYKTYQVGDMSSVQNPYSDTESHWARDYISYMSQRGVVSGYGDDSDLYFSPDNNMSRAEFACMIANYLNINVYNYRYVELPYDDADSIPDWAYMQVQALYELGIMQGQQNGDSLVFSPSGYIKRSEYAAAAARLLPSSLYTAELNALDADSVPDWAKSSFETLITQGIMTGYDDYTLRAGSNVTRAEAVKILFSIG